MSDRTIHIAFGPVQEFLSQARRTRDLWSGSYLLSYLAASALQSASASGGKIILPEVSENPLFMAVKDRVKPAFPGERVGSVPHVAEIHAPEEKAASVAQAAQDGWRRAWERIAAAAKGQVQHYAPQWTAETESIWYRQTSEAWFHYWVLDSPESMGPRKTLRAFIDLPDESGEKCTCCGVRDALCGDNPARRGVRAFWEEFAQKSPEREISLDGGERLCAVCTVKRFFPRVSERAIGWEVPRNYPSTSSMASLPWRLDVLRHGAQAQELRDRVSAHIKSLEAAGVPNVSALRSFPAIEEAVKTWGQDQPIASGFIGYDGTCFDHDGVLSMAREGMIAEERKEGVLETLRELRASASQQGISPPGDSYALLAMDGDRMGEMLKRHQSRKAQVSAALGYFSASVIEIVESSPSNGRLIYSGGDDVLALLPSTTALLTAERLRREYQRTFERYLPEAYEADAPRPTISAGLVYAHVHAPLQQVVKTAHDMLDTYAKNGAGRDAIGIAVWKRSGLTIRFACKWERSIVGLVDEVRRGIEQDEFSLSFIHHLRFLLETTSHLTEAEKTALLAADFMKNRTRDITREDAERAVEALQRLASMSGRDRDIEPVLLAAYLARGEE